MSPVRQAVGGWGLGGGHYDRTQLKNHWGKIENLQEGRGCLCLLNIFFEEFDLRIFVSFHDTKGLASFKVCVKVPEL